LVVKLVIQLNDGAPDTYSSLFGCTYSREVIDPTCEHLIADLVWRVPGDQPLKSTTPCPKTRAASFRHAVAGYGAWLRREFADLPALRLTDARRETADQHLAVMVLVDVDWVGCYRKTDTYWSCTYQLLTPQGKQLYDHLASLYPGATLRLLTLLREMR
jgi:hypothetical protein